MRARGWSLVLAGLFGVVLSPFHEHVGAQSGVGVPRVVISEYRFRGPSGSSDEFVELFNQGSADADISGWRLRSSNDAGTIASLVTMGPGTILKRGCFYLLANSAGYSAGVPANRTFVNVTSDNGSIAILNASSATPIDQVGNGTSLLAFGEGTRLPAFTASTDSQSYHRRTDPAAGFVDTNNNAADFQLISPATPRNSNQANCLTPESLTVNVGSSPTLGEQGQQVLVLATVTPATLPGSTNVQVTGDLSALGGSPSAVFTDNGVAPDEAASDNVFTSAVVVPYSTPLGSRAVTVTAVDAQARTATRTAAIEIVGPAAMYMPHEVQGSGATSPLPNGTLATVRGVVTARTADGFFFQTQSGMEDADPETSEGLFVRMDGPVPAAAAVAHFVQVTGAVNERGSPSLTELHPVVAVHDLGDGSLPDAYVLTTDDLSAAGDTDQLERFEGMRVTVPSLTAVSGTDPDGAFFSVITGQARPFREPGVEPGAAVLSCAIGPCNVPLFDGNPERLRVDSDALAGTSAVHVSTSAVMSDVTGPLGFDSGAFTIFAEALDAAGGMDTTAAVAAAADQFTVASFSLGGALDAHRLAKASSMVRDILNMPDIVGVQDVAALADLTALAQAVDADAAAAGQSAPQYAAEWVDGADGLGTGVLLKSAGGRVSAPPAAQVGAGMTIVDPANGSEHPLFDRPSVLVQATVTGPSTALPQNVTVVVNHLAPQAGVALDDSEGVLVREKRKAQAEVLADFVQARQGEALVSLGDYNAFSFNDGYIDTVGTIAGSPAPANEVALSTTDVVTPDLLNVSDQGALWDLYSSIANGNAQALDHALVTATLESQVVGVARPRVNADFPAADGGDQNTPNRLSDRDPMVVYFTFPADVTPPALHGVPGSLVVEATGADGATVTFVLPTATDNLDPSVAVVCTPASGATFAFVNGGVTCTAQDAAGNTASESFGVTVRDTTGPSLTMPADVTVEAASAAGAAVTFGATATDAVTPSPVVTCSPASGSTFALGATTVQCSSQDAADNTSTASFLVTVQDTIAPVLSLPGNIAGPTTSSVGRVVSFTATATDAVTSSPAVDCAPVSGSTFAVGDTVVTCAAADTAGNVATGSFTVTVTSTAPPPVFGHLAGVGSVIHDEQRVWFAFDVRESSTYERGWVTVQVRGGKGRPDRYLAAAVSTVQMSNAPDYASDHGPSSGIDTVSFAGTGSWNGAPGYRFEITASDRGEPGRGRDGFSLTVFAPNGAVVESVSGLLRDGNIRSLR